jgi:hypothetical protein
LAKTAQFWAAFFYVLKNMFRELSGFPR